ncbi:MAG: hypothetical protein WC842_04325 [Candidatus Paceibacterota bacterium]|jgi:hypothetical protein
MSDIAPRDENKVTAMLATSSVDLTSTVKVIADPTSRKLLTDTILTDSYGFSVENTPMGEMRMVTPVRLSGSSFSGSTIDSNFWTSAATGGAGGSAIAQSGSEITLTSGTANADSVTLFSVRNSRYVGGSSMRFRALCQFASGTENNKRRIGIGFGSTAMPAVTDGAWFQLSGTTFSVVTCKGGAINEQVISSGSFNGVLGTTYTPPTTVITLEIYWTNSKVWFVIGDDILHTVSASTETWGNTMSYHIFASSLNSDTAISKTLKIRTATISRMGNLETLPMTKNITGVNTSQIFKYSAGTLHRIIVGTPVNGKTITIYDNVTGTTNPIGIITLPAQSVPIILEYRSPFFNGLNVVPNDTGLNLTVVYE